MAADLNQTQKLLDAITDEGLFEQLAMAMLRRANPAYSTLIHTGVNADGKTIKSPVDGIAVVPGPDAPHLILPCHTTCRREDLRKKWLYDPNASDLSKSTKAPEGDLIKASNIAGEERDRTPNIAVTVVLTTNREPTEDLVRDVQAEARKYDFNLDIWSRSRLSDFLDHHPDGQYLRKRFLGLEQELLSKELLHELSANAWRRICHRTRRDFGLNDGSTESWLRR
jgi:hypothetical protein